MKKLCLLIGVLCSTLPPSACVGQRILFDSNRGGTFGIYTMNSDGSDVQAVIDTEKEDMFPDASPDGRWIVFARLDSTKEESRSDVWICRPDGSDARRLAKDGTFPSFSADGSEVYFERGRRKVMAVTVKRGKVREVYPGRRKDFKGYQIVKPRVSPDGKWVAFISDRGENWNTWVVELGSGDAKHVSKGCEPAWFPDSRRLAWVLGGKTKQKAGLFMWDRETDEAEELQDDGPPFGHEYFPNVSRDGRFLLWGACPEGQHDHADSNYQIFVKELDGGRPRRITEDSYCNRWPSLLPGGQSR